MTKSPNYVDNRFSIKLIVLFSLLIVFSLQVQAQKVSSTSISKGQIDLEKLVKYKNSEYVVTAENISRVSGIHHQYLRQAINGLEVYGTESSIHTSKIGKTIALYNNFVGDIQSTVTASAVSLSGEQAIFSVAQQMGYSISNLERIENLGGSNQQAIFNKGGISKRDIPVKLMYYYQKESGTRMVWELSIFELNSGEWWNFRVDAASGRIIDNDSYIAECNNEATHDHRLDNLEIINLGKTHYEALDISTCPEVEDDISMMVPSYRVYAMPIESPNHGARSLVTNVINATASPFGWHSNGNASFTTTRGNNVIAREDWDGNNTGGFEPSEQTGGMLDFDFSINTVYSNAAKSEEAAITNLFYWNNIIHDVTYQYGFDEASGNFQWNNNGNGGAEIDPVIAEAQDAADNAPTGTNRCNANFGTPPDGGVPGMQMYVCGSRDGDLDNAVIVHEYGHGISNRLVGGAANASCLGNAEQMGEGWSDFYGLMLTMEPGDLAADARTVGTWLIGEDETGPGFRTFPYSTNFGVNSLTYDDVNSEAIPHGVGSVWATMLWEMTWGLIDNHGYSPDLYTFTGNVNTDAGNVQALALVTEGLKLTVCSPGVIDGRDAILAADTAIYGGANHCVIWEAFARRGAGASADQGLSSSVTDGTAAFDLPTNIAGFDNSIENACLNGGVLAGLSGGFPNGGTYAGPGVTDTGNAYSFNPLVAGIGTHDITYTVNDFCNGNSSTIFTETIDVQNDVLALSCPSDLIIESDSSTICSAAVVYNFPVPEGDLCDRTVTGLTQNTSPFNAALDYSGTPSGHLRSFNLTTQGITRDYHIDGIDVGINDNIAGVSPLTVNIYLASQISGVVTGKSVPLSGLVQPYASAVSLVPAGSAFTHNVPMDVFLPAGTQFHVEVISPSSRDFMIAYNNAGNGNPANETTVGYLGAVGGANVYAPPSGIGFGHYAVLIEVTGAESNEYTTTQTAGLVPGASFPAGTTTNTFLTNAQSGGNDSCSFDITVIGKTTIYSGGVWSPVLPDVGSNVKFSDNYNTSSGNITACSCEIDSGSTVTVGVDNYLDIYGNISVDGSLIVEHTGNVVQTDDTALVTNNGTINVELTTPVLNARDFMILGSPMTAEDNAMFSAYQVLNHTTSNFEAYVGVPPVVGVNFHDQNFNDWTDYTGTINAGEGYLVRPSYTAGGTYNYVYDQGTLNNGVVTYTAFFGTDKEDSPSVLSNPYASALNAELFINSNPIINEVYFWEHITTPNTGIPGPLGENFSMEDISTYNGLMGIPASSGVGAPNGGTVPNGIIATGQGFGIKANSGGDVTFNNSMRLTSGNTTLRLTDDKDLIWLVVRENTYGLGSTTGIGFTENATAGLDESFDTMKLGTVVSLYSHLQDGSELLGIQGREAFDTSITIPMGFSTLIEADSGIPYVISIDKLEGINIEQATIYLIDHLSNTVTNLSTDRYEFMSDAGTFDNRFTLQFEPIVLGTNNLELDSISIYPNPTDNTLNIVSPNAVVTLVEVYDLRGRVVAEEAFTSPSNYQVSLSELETALYFVKVTTDKGTINKRVIKQ